METSNTILPGRARSVQLGPLQGVPRGEGRERENTPGAVGATGLRDKIPEVWEGDGATRKAEHWASVWWEPWAVPCSRGCCSVTGYASRSWVWLAVVLKSQLLSRCWVLGTEVSTRLYPPI